MLKRLHLALMVTPVIASFLSITILPVRAADASDNPGALTATTDEHGRRVWVNESTTKPKPVRQNQSWAGFLIGLWDRTAPSILDPWKLGLASTISL